MFKVFRVQLLLSMFLLLRDLFIVLSCSLTDLVLFALQVSVCCFTGINTRES